jgi:predicted phosphate transport protein (TIGR00153 family)
MLGWFRKLLPREDRFFDLFSRHAATVVAGAAALDLMLAGGSEVEQHCREIVRLETEADAITAEVMQAVRKSFVTPFDRGDIKDLIQSLDDAIDRMVKTVTLFEQREFDPLMRQMGGAIVEAAGLVAEAVRLLERPGPNAARLSEIIEEVLRVEGRSDEMHDQGLRELYRRHRDGNAMAFVIGSEIYGELERVVDSFEDVANEISGILIENV